MAFNYSKVVGNDTAQDVVINSSNTESVVHNLVAYNTTGGALSFSLLIDGTEIINESVDANGSYRLPDKINVPATATLAINAPTGVSVTVSYLQQAIDVNAALTVAQQYAAEAKADANRAENALPAGSIDDASTAADRAWSADKIGTELSGKADLTGADFTGGVSTHHATVTSTTNSTVLDLSTANSFKHVLTENTTLSVTNVPVANQYASFTVDIAQDALGSGFTVTWFNGVIWPSATAPTLTSNTGAVDTFVFKTYDAGTTWYGFTAGQAMATAV
jgi:hypothetical protein